MKLVILDRDGVINEDSDDYVKSPDEWRAIPGSLEAIARLNHEGFRVIVVSNQSGVGRGLFDIDALNAIHQKMHMELSRVGGHVDAIFFCPHAPADQCPCRKPKAGLFGDIQERFHTSLQGVPAVGDSLRDVEAAQSVGAAPFLVRTGKGLRSLESSPDALSGVPVFDNLSAVVAELVDRD